MYDALERKYWFSHSLMIPWTAEFLAGVMGEGWDAEMVLDVAREDAKRVYGV